MCTNVGDDFTVSSGTRRQLDEETARFVLERTDKLAHSSLEQLRKSTDRAYTLFGLLLTAFSGVTVFVLSTTDIYFLLPALVLCVGLFVSINILFNKGICVHGYSDIGDKPQNLLKDKNIEMLKKRVNGNLNRLNREYIKNAIFDSIEDAAFTIRVNDNSLRQRVEAVKRTMKVIKATMYIAAFVSLVALITKFVIAGVCCFNLASA